jgi:iron complex transport system ATP-binding protein
MKLLKTEAARGRGVLAVLHDLTLAARFCDRLIALKDGGIVVDVAAAELTPSQVSEIYGVEAFVGERAGERFVLPWSAS